MRVAREPQSADRRHRGIALDGALGLSAVGRADRRIARCEPPLLALFGWWLFARLRDPRWRTRSDGRRSQQRRSRRSRSRPEACESATGSGSTRACRGPRGGSCAAARACRSSRRSRASTSPVYRGEALGIVGVNGSGKSTLLQIIAGTTLPTSGEMTVRGPRPAAARGRPGLPSRAHRTRERDPVRVLASGSRVGTIEDRMEAVAAFAELERHMDTPVKRFSSGMISRLSFAVAMQFPADIYVFDEVLAVVDGEFQARCLEEIKGLHRARAHGDLRQPPPRTGGRGVRARDSGWRTARCATTAPLRTCSNRMSPSTILQWVSDASVQSDLLPEHGVALAQESP